MVMVVTKASRLFLTRGVGSRAKGEWAGPHRDVVIVELVRIELVLKTFAAAEGRSSIDWLGVRSPASLEIFHQ